MMIVKGLIYKTFNKKLSKLPSIKDFSTILLDHDSFDTYNYKSFEESFRLRREYTKHSFPILTHEFFNAIRKMTLDLKIKNVAELHCGIGWITHWLKKYNIPVSASIDNKTWRGFENRYMKHVDKFDSVEYVKSNPKVNLYILSWPYMDETADNIWGKMQSKQYLLYIGEDDGGCTASETFFKNTCKNAIKDKWGLNKSFISFYGIHDRPFLFQK